MTDALLISAQRLYKTYRIGATDRPVLRGVDLSIRAGEFVAVVGASGSGKSTLLHLLGTLEVPDLDIQGRWRGQVIFDGRSLFEQLSESDLDRLRNREIGFVFQFYHLLPELNVLENVLMPLRVGLSWWEFRRRRAELTAEANELLGNLKLGHCRQQAVTRLSGGERQRVAIARALIGRPRLLLADEPTGNLDSENGRVILDALRKLHGERRQTLVMVTHDRSVAERADRIVRLVDGQVVG